MKESFRISSSDRKRLCLPFFLAIGLATGCTMVQGISNAVAAGNAEAGPPQFLPVKARWCLDGGVRPVCLQLEVPSGEKEFSWGLQMRPPLPPQRGMWFAFSPPTPARFWMHRTPEPLDMIFLKDNRVIHIEAKVTPCMRLPCRSYGPNVPVDGVVELAGGEARSLGITVGSQARIVKLETTDADAEK